MVNIEGSREKQNNPARPLREFNRMAKHARPALVQTFPGEDSGNLVDDARREFAALIPQLPDIGGKQPFTRFIEFTAMWLAVYRVLQTHGKTVEESGGILYRISRSILQSYPVVIVRMFGRNIFSRRYRQNLQKRAAESQLRQYAEDYVYAYVAGDGVSFDFGVDYLECGGCKFLTKQGAAELAPFLCPADIEYSERFGWGLRRTMTLAEGAPKCDFRFKKGGQTTVKVPAAMEGVVRET